ncbi:hypothetical protein GCM10029992_00400 [Glycomyces albus]
MGAIGVPLRERIRIARSSRRRSPIRPRSVTGPVRTAPHADPLWDTEIQCLRQKVDHMTTLDARMLGPLEIRIGGKAATIHGNNARKLLAVLLDEANRPVPVEGIVRGVWEDELPERPVRAARNLVSDLRRDLRPFDDRIGITDGGEAYAIRIEPGELDLHRCRERQRDAAVLRGATPPRRPPPCAKRSPNGAARPYPASRAA